MAKIFRLQNNVPDIYVEESRDFQNMCNVFDIMNSGVKYDIDTMTNVLDTTQCKNSFLPLLQTKLGFYTSKDLTNQEIRHVLLAFKRLVKDKGCDLGIREALEIYLKLLNTKGTYRVTITNKDMIKHVMDPDTDHEEQYSVINNVYLVEIQIESKLTSLDVLKEMLKYIIPTGYNVKFGFYQSHQLYTDVLTDKEGDTLEINFIETKYNDVVQPVRDFDNISESSNLKELLNRLRGNVGTTHTITNPHPDDDQSDTNLGD